MQLCMRLHDARATFKKVVEVLLCVLFDPLAIIKMSPATKFDFQSMYAVEVGLPHLVLNIGWFRCRWLRRNVSAISRRHFAYGHHHGVVMPKRMVGTYRRDFEE